MSGTRISVFNGIIPQSAPRVLPDGNAQLASNVKLTSSELKPLRGLYPTIVPAKPMPALAFYLAREGNNSAWLSWPYDVDVVKSPLPSSVESRYYWTGDGEPRFGKYSDITAGGGNDYPHSYFSLGIPKPVSKPTVTSSGGVGSAVTRYYCYTFFSQYGEESAPSPVSVSLTGKVDDTWAIAGMDVAPANSGTGTATFSSGVTTFANAASALTWLRTGDTVTISGTDMLVTGTPSSSSFTVAGDYHTATAWARKAPWNTANMKKRLYRTSGTLGTFQLVDDTIAIGTTTYNDNKTDANILGDELISTGWLPPPTDLKALIVHSSGALIGISGNQICMSEPYQPHAWNPAYQLSTDYNGIGLATYGSSVIVTTSGNPYEITGVDPASMTMEKISGSYPCLSKRSHIDIGDAVIYASSYGLVSIGVNGVIILTQRYFRKDDWAFYKPENMVCEFANGYIYIATIDANGVRKVLVMDSDDLVIADVETYELYTDKSTGKLYASTATNISEWDSSAAVPLQGSWKSKIFMYPKPVNLGAAKIEFDLSIDPDARQAIINQIASIKTFNDAVVATGILKAGYNAFMYNGRSVNGSLLKKFPDLPPSNEITFTLFYDGKVYFARVVKDNKAFKLPAGKKSDTIEIQISSQCGINEIRIAETMEGLKEL